MEILLNVWPHTLRRTPRGHRRYKESQMMAMSLPVVVFAALPKKSQSS